jgi:hypothetical protein
MSISMVHSDDDEAMKGYEMSISTPSSNVAGPVVIIVIASFFLMTPLPPRLMLMATNRLEEPLEHVH